MLGNAYCACPDCTTSTSLADSMVCASDGLSYAGSCWVKRAACLKKEEIVVVKNEPCGKWFIHISCRVAYLLSRK